MAKGRSTALARIMRLPANKKGGKSRSPILIIIQLDPQSTQQAMYAARMRSTARRTTGRTPAIHDADREFPAGAARSRSPEGRRGPARSVAASCDWSFPSLTKAKTLIVGVKVMAVHIQSRAGSLTLADRPPARLECVWISLVVLLAW